MKSPHEKALGATMGKKEKLPYGAGFAKKDPKTGKYPSPNGKGM